MKATSRRIQTDRGETTLILGCMFSGKTTELIARVEPFPTEIVLGVKHKIDTRFRPDAIISHTGKAIPAVPVACALEILERVSPSVRVVAVDEGHFFAPDLIDVIGQLNRRGIRVVVASLEPDSWGRPFPLNEMLRMRFLDCVIKTARCGRCGATADRTQRLTPIVAGNMVVSPSNYEPRCRDCWCPPTAI